MFLKVKQWFDSPPPRGRSQPRRRSHLRRQKTPLPPSPIEPVALEPRLLFDGALAATAVDAGLDADAERVVETEPLGPSDAGTADIAADAAASPARSPLVVIDARVADWQTLVAGLPGDTRVVRLDADRDGIAQIAQALLDHDGEVSSLHVISHGEPGRAFLGSSVLDQAAIAGHTSALAGIGESLAPDADLLLYGCDIAQGDEGADFLVALARATDADVAASDDRTGAQHLGGDWTLERQIGAVETGGIIDAQARDAWNNVLAPAPTLSIGVPVPAGGEGAPPSGAASDPLLGESFDVTVTLDNADAVDTGFTPYLDVFVPVTGIDGGATPDGLTLDSATLYGRSLTIDRITLSGADIGAGSVDHPLFRDSGSSAAVSIPAGMQVGDELAVVRLPLSASPPTSRRCRSSCRSPSVTMPTLARR